MSNPSDNDSVLDRQRLKAIPVWARRYAQNRTLGVIVQLGAFVVAWLGFAGLPFLANVAFARGVWVGGVGALVVLLGLMVGWLWFWLGGWRRVVPPVTGRLYGREGAVSVGLGTGGPSVGWGPAVVLGVGVVGEAILLAVGVLPIWLMQPVSTIYVIPFFAWLLLGGQRPVSPFLLLWPVLYAAHAGLVIAGVPMQFGGPLAVLNIGLPIVGYGIIAALAGHVYSRYALRRLQAAAEAPKEGSPNGGGRR